VQSAVIHDVQELIEPGIDILRIVERQSIGTGLIERKQRDVFDLVQKRRISTSGLEDLIGRRVLFGAEQRITTRHRDEKYDQQAV